MALVVIVLMSSCLTVGRIQRNCDKFAAVCGGTTTTVIEYRDTTIYIDKPVWLKLPKDTAKLVLNLGKGGDIKDGKTSIKSGIVTINTEVKDSVLKITSFINKDSIVSQLRDSLKIAIKSEYSKTIVPVKECYIPGWYKFWGNIGIVLTSLVVLAVGWFIFKNTPAGALLKIKNLF